MDNILRALNDVRKMRRAVRAREETDPEKVAEILETVMQEAIVIRANSGGVFGKGAIKELRQIQKGLISEQIDAGSRTTEFMGKYASILDQIDNIETETRSNNVGRGALQEQVNVIRDSLPSAETITSAIMTGNPLLGYTIKIGRDLLQSRKEAKIQRAEIQRQEGDRIKALASEQSAFDTMHEAQSEVAEVAKSEKKERSGRRRGIYEPTLQEIRDAIIRLHKLEDGDVDVLVERVSAQQAEVLEKVKVETVNPELERVVTETNDHLAKVEKVNRDQLEHEQHRDQQNKFAANEDKFEGRGQIDSTAILGDKGGKGGGIFPFGLAGLFGGLGGLVGGGLVALLIKPFVAMFGFLKNAGKLLLKFGKFTGLLAVVTGLFNFFDGFMSAGEILGKDADQVGWADRIKVGFSQAIASILEPIDAIFRMFGGDGFLDKKGNDLTRDIFSMMNFETMIDDYVTWLKDYYTDLFDTVMKPFRDLKEKVSQWFEFDMDVGQALRDFFSIGDGGNTTKPRQSKYRDYDNTLSDSSMAITSANLVNAPKLGSVVDNSDHMRKIVDHMAENEEAISRSLEQNTMVGGNNINNQTNVDNRSNLSISKPREGQNMEPTLYYFQSGVMSNAYE